MILNYFDSQKSCVQQGSASGVNLQLIGTPRGQEIHLFKLQKKEKVPAHCESESLLCTYEKIYHSA